MRVRDLARLLKTFDEDSEIRVSACLEDPTFGGSSHDLPLVGISSELAPAHLPSVTTPDGPETLWLVTSYLLQPRPQPSSRRKKSKSRD